MKHKRVARKPLLLLLLLQLLLLLLLFGVHALESYVLLSSYVYLQLAIHIYTFQWLVDL